MTVTSKIDYAELEAFALILAKAASEIALPLFRSESLRADNKYEVGFDPVTEADQGSERAIRALIEAHYPDHGIIGEEYGNLNPEAEWVWVLDPIDGTRAFISGLPLWTTLIGLRHKDKPVLGLIAQPVLNEVFLGSPLGSKLITQSGTKPLRVSKTETLASAIAATTCPNLYDAHESKSVNSLRHATKLTRYGYDAYAFAMVALGTMDLAFETGLKAWDIDAIIPIIENAGGIVCDWQGQTVGAHGGQVLAVGSEALKDEALKHLRSAAN
jgi:histidinol phosphatase-like enzyme (inositol monophosphatase family)